MGRKSETTSGKKMRQVMLQKTTSKISKRNKQNFGAKLPSEVVNFFLLD
jgi:hypothetical protein